MSTVFLRRLSRWQAETEREDIGDLYAAAHEGADGGHPLPRAEFVGRFADQDVRQPGFDLVVASDPQLVGCVWGFRADRGSEWWDGFADVPTEIAELTGARQVFVVSGPFVLPRRRRQQVATKALRLLLSRNAAALALTLLDPGNAPGRAAYQSWGWTKAGQLTPRDGAAPRETWALRP